MADLRPGISRRRLLLAASGATVGAALRTAEAEMPTDQGSSTDLPAQLAGLLAPTDPSRHAYIGFEGELFAAGAGATLHPLSAVRGLGTSQRVSLDAAIGWRVLQQEILYFCDPGTGAILDTLKNPFTGETVAVEPLALALDDANPAEVDASMTSHDTGRWRLESDRVIVNLPAHLTRSIRLDAHTGVPAVPADRLSHLIVCSATRVDLQRSANVMVPSTGVRTTMLPWPDWLHMGHVPGFCVLHLTVTSGLETPGQLNAALVDHTNRHFPAFLAPPIRP